MAEKAEKKINKPQITSRIQNALIGICATDDGRDVLRYLADICGFHKTSVVMDNTGKVVIENVIYNEARRNVYLEIRNLIPERRLKVIEHTLIKVKGEDDVRTL